MIRLFLFAVGFVAITVALLVFQPGAKPSAMFEPQSETVTRAEPTLTPATGPVAAPQAPAENELKIIRRVEPVVTPEQTEVAVAPAPVPQPAPQPAPRVVAPIVAADPSSDEDLRRMTWSTLNKLNSATGQDAAPGEPGSLLHTIVRRSLTDPAQPGAPRVAAPQQQDLATYVVEVGDSLISIAEKIYGDVNMTGPLFAANAATLTRPDDLRPGQTLVLPRR